jgi:hypothetical protein
VSVFVLSSPLDLLTYHCPVRSSMHAAVAVDQRHIRSKKLRPLIVPMYAQRPAWQAWRGSCFRMSGPRDWDAAKRARLKCHWGGGEGSEESRKPKLVGIAPTRCKSFLVGLTSLPRSVGGSAPEKPTRGRTPGNSGHSTVRGTSALTASRFLLSPHLTSPHASCGRRSSRTRVVRHTAGFCQLLSLGPVRRAARAPSISHHLHCCDASRICKCKLNDKPLSLRQCVPASQTQSHACCNLIAAGSSLARRFARSLQIHTYYY